MLVRFEKRNMHLALCNPILRNVSNFLHRLAFRELDRYRVLCLEPFRNGCYSFSLIMPFTNQTLSSQRESSD